MRTLLVIAAIGLMLGLSPTIEACPHFVAWVTCSDVGPGPGMVTWVVEWNDGGSQCCSYIEVFVQNDCTGSYDYHGTVKCSEKVYRVSALPGQKAFKLVRYNPSGEYYATTYLACTECD